LRELTYGEAIREALRNALIKNPKVFLIGEDIGAYGGAFKITNSFLEEFGGERIMDTPISEAAIVGAAIGAALMGLKPIAEIMYMDFIPICLEQLANQAAKIRFMSGGKLKVPIIVRTQYSLGRAHGAQHSQFTPAWFLQVPGLKVALPSTPYDAKGLLNQALKDDNPVLYIECSLLYRVKGPVPEEDYAIPFGEADVKKEGEDVTVIAISRMVHEALAAANILEEKGLSVEVIDPRTIQPLDIEAIVNSVKKTGRVIIAEDDCKTGGLGAEIAALIVEKAFDYLDAPITRVAAPDLPIPFSPKLELEYMPNKDKIIQAVNSLLKGWSEMHQVIIPRFDPAMKTGRIIKWLKNEGEAVNKGESIAIVEGEKTVFEVEAPEKGFLRKILYPAGSEIEVLKPIALIGELNEAIPQELIEKVEAKIEEAKKPIEKPFIKPVKHVKASPLAKKLAEEYGVNLEEIEGTGPGGRITKEDVLNAVKKQSLTVKPFLTEASIAGLKPPLIAKIIPLSRTRKTIAERLLYSLHEAASTTIVASVNLENLLEYREKIKASLGEVSLTAFIVKAVAKALETHSIFNSTLEKNEIKIFEEINIALAIHTEDGLVTPVIKNSNKKSILEISNIIKELTNKAFQRKLSIEEVTGGTFTITNLGAYDVEIFIPIINPPQTAILGVGKIEKKPIVVNEEKILIKPIAVLTLVFDHRVVDGVPAAKFLQEIKRLLENPSELS